MENIPILKNEIIDEFHKRFFDIPFGNSAFQNIKFIMEAQYTPARGYRAAGLRLADRIQSLQECQFNLRLDEIDVEQYNETINNIYTDKFEQRRAKIKLQKKLNSIEYTKKLVNDAVVECLTLWEAIKTFPEYTREQFENEEQQHFEISLSRQATGFVGAVDSLDLISKSAENFTNRLKKQKQLYIEKENG